VQLSLTLLTRSDTFYTSRRLMEAARARGVAVDWVDAGSAPGAALDELRQRGRLPDLVLPRVGSRHTSAELAVLTALIDAGVFSPASPKALYAAMDKAETCARLSAADIPTVPGAVVVSAVDGIPAWLGDGPFVVKPRLGSQGRDVLMAVTRRELPAKIEEVLARNEGALVQPLIPMRRPRDLRVLVIDGVAAAGCWRIAADGEFRSNVHLGASTEAAALDDEATRVACAAAQALGLAHAGVDLLPTPSGYLVLEINGSPGLEGIEAATGRDLAGEVVDWALRALSAGATSSASPRSARSRSPSPPTRRP
jgi:ribosomal protein S6--L-glutamate ligase